MGDDYMEIQRRNFEAQFGSLENLGFEDKTKVSDDEFHGFNDEERISESSGSEASDDELATNDNSDMDSDMDDDRDEADEGSEASEEEEPPKIIKIQDNFTTPILSKKQQRLMTSGRAPTLAELERKSEASNLTPQQKKMNKLEDEENLENDVKLQRLLSESHILSQDLKYSGADVTLQTLDYEDPTGKARKKALTSRIRNLSSHQPHNTKLESMPMSMRKGMIKSREKKIAKYEQEAKDAGIILSKVKKGELRDLNMGKGSTFQSDRLGHGIKKSHRVRDRGLKINSIGKSTKNGLIISKQEIDRVNNKSNPGRFKKSRRR